MESWLALGLAALATGIAGGMISGLLGVGGGIVIVPVLESMLGHLGVDPLVRMPIAVATSLPSGSCTASRRLSRISTLASALPLPSNVNGVAAVPACSTGGGASASPGR